MDRMQTTLPTHDLVLIGAGHTNMHIARMWRMEPIPDVRLTIVSPFSRSTYSGMLPGTLAGLYEPEQMEIDLHRFASTVGARLIVEDVVGFDATARRVQFADRPEIRYDIASIGIGSIPAGRDLWAAHSEILSIKPMATFQSRLDNRLREAAVARPGQAVRVCVVGGGAAGVEVTFCLESMLTRTGIDAELSLLDSGSDILSGYTPRAVMLAHREFKRRGINIRPGCVVTGYADGQLHLQDADPFTADVVIWATSAAPPSVLESFDLPKADDGFLATRPTLQSTGSDAVFVVGDTATFVDRPLPKAGVYAVREGPVLWENIRRRFNNQLPVVYDAQSGFLSMLATGDGRAIGQYKGRAFHGGWVWKWKDHIDRKFMRMFQDYRPMSPEMMAAQSGAASDDVPRMRCRGCGGKVGANVLSAALERLNVPAHQHALKGLNEPDDAALLDPSAGPVDVISVDFFQAFLDDPYFVGRVAALNALSDLWAMGSDPVGAMTMVTLPEGEPRQQTELLYQLLAGGLHEFELAGATLLGGHTTESSDLTIGYTVIGSLAGRPPMTKGNLNAGDQLVLTKPLGTGVLLVGHAECITKADWMDGMLSRMLLSNAAGAKLAREFDVAGLTDVTGFGLAGHLLEMLDAAGRAATISLSALPLLNGFRELNASGLQSTLAPANRETEDRLDISQESVRQDSAFNALFDPQTSGGLLIAVSTAKCDDIVAALRETGYAEASVIGTVGEASSSPKVTVAQ
jgi:selenide,water dikinase